MDLLTLLAQFLALAGVGGLVSLLINVGKWIGWVKDGTAQSWSTIMNLVLFVGFVILKMFMPIQLGTLNDKLLVLVPIFESVFAAIIQLLGSKLGHLALKGVPVIGSSYTLDVTANG
jgi:hypothetical protein